MRVLIVPPPQKNLVRLVYLILAIPVGVQNFTMVQFTFLWLLMFDHLFAEVYRPVTPNMINEVRWLG